MRRRTSSIAAPVRADDPFLTEFLEALRKRSKALKHRNWSISIDRIVERQDGEDSERIALHCEQRPRQRVSFELNAKREVYLSASESIAKAGWKFTYSDYGRLLPSVSGRTLVALLETTLTEMFEMTERKTYKFGQIWQAVLAKGPQAI